MKKICLFLLLLIVSVGLFADPIDTNSSKTLKVALNLESAADSSFGITNKDGLQSLETGIPETDLNNQEQTFEKATDSNDMVCNTAYVWFRISKDKNKYKLTIKGDQLQGTDSAETKIEYTGNLGTLQNSNVASITPTENSITSENGTSVNLNLNNMLYYGAFPINLTVPEANLENIAYDSKYTDDISITVTINS